MGVSILSDGMGKPFSVRPAADNDFLCGTVLFFIVYFCLLPFN